MRRLFITLLTVLIMMNSCSESENVGPSDDGSFTDMAAKTLTDYRDDNVYKIVTIGNQVWMAENLKYLPEVDKPETYSPSTPHYYVYDYEGTDIAAAKATSNYNTYGVLYNWPAAANNAGNSKANPSGVRGVCPQGWHLPSDAEWVQLFDHLGGISVAGGKMKEKGTTHWQSPNWNATNESGFSALPGGANYVGSHINLGKRGGWWSTTEENPDGDVYYLRIDNDRSEVLKWAYNRQMAVCVRCVMD